MKSIISFILSFLWVFKIQTYIVEPGTAGGAPTAKSVDDQLLELSEKIGRKLDKIGEIEKSIAEGKQSHAELKKSYDDLTKLVADAQKQFNEFRRASLAAKSANRRKGEVSDECAKHLAAIAIVRAVGKNQLPAEKFATVVKDILGAEIKALTGTEIPLAIDFSREVIELVAEYGAARKYGTVFPLGAATVKLPLLGATPAFGPIAMSAKIDEKKPTLGFATFNPEKWGGLVVIPSEIDADSLVPLGQFIARYVAREMAKVEDLAYFTADGSPLVAGEKGLTVRVAANGKLATTPAGKTKVKDITLADLRVLRSKVATPALAAGAYYMHPSFEQFLNNLNTGVYKPYVANGLNGATLDGFPIRWIEQMPVYTDDAQPGAVIALFGDITYHYLGVRGGFRFDTSLEARFETDEIVLRALERFTCQLLAPDAVAGLQLAAA